MKCIDAEMDLRPGGRYRIGNQLPDGKVLWITGEFEEIERPRKLVYTWRIEGQEARDAERVTVQFEESGGFTEVTVTHERIASEELRDMHRDGWVGCLAGLARFVESATK